MIAIRTTKSLETLEYKKNKLVSKLCRTAKKMTIDSLRDNLSLLNGLKIEKMKTKTYLRSLSKNVLQIMHIVLQSVRKSYSVKRNPDVIFIRQIDLKNIILMNREETVKISKQMNIETAKKRMSQLKVTILDKNQQENQQEKRYQKMLKSRFFEEIIDKKYGNEFKYNDIYVLSSSKNIINDLKSEVSASSSMSKDTFQIVEEFTTASRKLPPLCSNYKKTATAIKEIYTHTGIHKQDEDHICTYEKCFNVFKKERFYEPYLYNFNQDDVEDEFDDWFSEKYYLIRERSLHPLPQDENLKKRDKFRLVPGWETQIVPIESGNCLKDSLFKMREMILEKYSDILEFNQFGVVNDEKEFTRLANSIDDHDVESLDYFSFLLSTGSVYFINSEGFEVHNSINHGNLMVPNFYSCFFLIEENDDGTGHISPINFGILTKKCRPFSCKMTSIQKFYGKKKKKTKDNRNTSCSWVDDLVDWAESEFLHENGSMSAAEINRLDNNFMLSRDSNGQEIWITTERMPENARFIYQITKDKILSYMENMQKYRISKKDGSRLSDTPQDFKNNLAESLTGEAWQRIFDTCIRENDDEEDNDYKKYLKNVEQTLTNNNPRDFDPDSDMKKKKLFKTLETNNTFKKFVKKNKDHENITKSLRKGLRKGQKQIDNNIYYDCSDITKKVVSFEYKNISVVEYKQPGLLDLFTPVQALYYHIAPNQDCKYIVCTSFLNNIIYKHSMKKEKHVFKIIWNDTIYRLDGGFDNKLLCGFFGFKTNGTSIKNWEKYKETLESKRDDKLQNVFLDMRPVRNKYSDDLQTIPFCVWIVMKFWEKLGTLVKKEAKTTHKKYKEYHCKNDDIIPELTKDQLRQIEQMENRK